MLAFEEFANFINLNAANLAATYAQLLAQQSKAYANLPVDSRIASARKLLKAVTEVCESQKPDPLLDLFDEKKTNSQPRWLENIDAPQPMIELECLGQTLTPVVTNLEAGKFLWQILAETRMNLFDTEKDDQNRYFAPADINQDITENNRTELQHQEIESRYRGLFEDSPISLWEEDFSAVKSRLDQLQREGVTNFRAYFDEHPEVIGECAATVKIIDVNRATLELYKAGSKEEFFAGLHLVFSEESLDAFKEELIAITEGRTKLELEAINHTLSGERKNLDLTWAVAPGYEDTLSKVIISIIDITEQKQAQEALLEGEARYRSLFEDSPISLWEEDFSTVKGYIDQLRHEGVTDFRTYFENHAEIVADYATKINIIGVNRATLELFQANTIEEFFGGLSQIFGEESFEAFREELIAFAGGRLRFEYEAINYTLTGERKNLLLRAFVAPGYEESLGKVLISMIDVTDQKQLERQIQESLERRTRQVETSTEIAQEIALAPALDELFRQAVDLVQKQFGYYHAHIYTLQENTDPNDSEERDTYLVMQEGTGEAGRQMKARSHRIRLGAEQSLVARSARTGQAILIPDVSQAPGWLPNPLLPETKSELAIPIKLGDTVLGVLDVQSDMVDGLSDEDQLLLLGLCGQFAVAVNSHQIEDERRKAQEALAKQAAELETVAQVSTAASTILDTTELLQTVADLTLERFDLYQVDIYLLSDDKLRLAAGTGAVKPGISENESEQISLDQEDALVVRATRTGRPVIVNDVSQSSALTGQSLAETRSEMVLPLLASDRVLGVLDVRSDQVNRFTDADARIHTTLANQIATALENAQLFEQTRRRAQELTVLNELGQTLATRLNITQVFETIHQAASRLIDASNFSVALYDPDKDEVAIAFTTNESKLDRSIKTMPAGKGITGYIIHQRTALLIPENVAERLAELGIELVGEAARSFLGVPLIAGDQVLGRIAVQSFTRSRAYDERDQGVLSTIANQAAMALQNARQFEQIQGRAQREQTIREITEKMRTATSLDGLVKITAEELGHRFSADYTLVELGGNAAKSSEQQSDGYHR